MNTSGVFLISLYNKDPYAGWLKALDAQTDYRLVGTQGTADWSTGHGVDCETIGEVFGLDPRLGGKVKSLNPDLYTGVMAEDPGDLPESIPYVDGVAVDLTPFLQQGEFRPGKVDIGGPSLLRAAAKSWRNVTVVSSPDAAYYHSENLPTDEDDRRQLAEMAIRRTLRYDHELLPVIGDDENESDNFQLRKKLGLSESLPLRYGENPNQDASVDSDLYESGDLPFEVLTENGLSYTNCLDAEAARRLAYPDEKLQVAVIKHTNPTGWARGDDPEPVIKDAWEGDPKSAFGSVFGINQVVTETMVQAIDDYFVVAVIAPGFTDDALNLLVTSGSTQAIEWKRDWGSRESEFIRSIDGGYLLQNNSESSEFPEQWEQVGSVQVSNTEETGLRQMWRLCRWVNSNSAIIGTPDRVLGVGAGQQSRVDAVQIAVDKYTQFHDNSSDPLVMASDGFFPFPDNIEVAAEVGVDAIVSPGGSKRDDEVLAAASEHDVGMIFTGTRAFYH